MTLTRGKYRRVPDLYVQGSEVVLKDGTLLWLQAINPFQQDEAKMDAQAARARLILALKSTAATPERDIVRSWFLDEGSEQALDRLIETKLGPKMMDIVNALEDDPDWTERLLITTRSEELMAKAPEDAERQLLEQINQDYLKEIGARTEAEREWLQHKFHDLTEDELFEEYIDAYIERRGVDVSLAEYALTELWYAARVCDGIVQPDGSYDHANCEGHQLQAWETKAEVKALPEELQQLLVGSMAHINITVRDAKNSARQGSSSESSPLPSAPVESTPSTQTATSDGAPGT